MGYHLDNFRKKLGNAWDWLWGRDTDKKNYNLQREQFEYQKELNEIQMAREDNAMTRRSEDLKNAGINPLLAAGGAGAASGQMNAGNAPQENRVNRMEEMMRMLTMKAQYHHTLADTKKVQAETENTRSHTTSILQKTEHDSKMNPVALSSAMEKLHKDQQLNPLEIHSLRQELNHNEDILPLKVKELAQSINHKEQMNPALVTEIILSNANKSLENQGVVLDNKIKAFDVSTQDIEHIYRMAKASIAKSQGLQALERLPHARQEAALELLSKQIAVAIQDADLRSKIVQAEYEEDHDMPVSATTGTFGPIRAAGSYLGKNKRRFDVHGNMRWRQGQ